MITTCKCLHRSSLLNGYNYDVFIYALNIKLNYSFSEHGLYLTAFNSNDEDGMGS